MNSKKTQCPRPAKLLGWATALLAAFSLLLTLFVYFKVSAAMDDDHSSWALGGWVVGEMDQWSDFSYHELWNTISVPALLFCGGIVFLRNSSRPAFSNPAMALAYALITLPAAARISDEAYRLSFLNVVFRSHSVLMIVGFVMICLCLWGTIFRDPEGTAREQRDKLVTRAEVCGWISIIASILLVINELWNLVYDLIRYYSLYTKVTCGVGQKIASVSGELALVTGLLAFGILGINHKDIVEWGGLQNDTGDKKAR